MFEGTLQNSNCTTDCGNDKIYDRVNKNQGTDSLDYTIRIVRAQTDRRGCVLNRIDALNCLIKGPLLFISSRSGGSPFYTSISTFVISSTITTSCLSP